MRPCGRCIVNLCFSHRLSNGIMSIHQNLNLYVRAYHKQQWVRGGLKWLLFWTLISGGVFYFEYWFWLSKSVRTGLFFIGALGMLISAWKWIGIPFRWFLGGNGSLSYQDAARKIGDQLPEVQDKLLNFLQLSSVAASSPSYNEHNALLIASIEQKTKELSKTY